MATTTTAAVAAKLWLFTLVGVACENHGRCTFQNDFKLVFSTSHSQITECIFKRSSNNFRSKSDLHENEHHAHLWPRQSNTHCSSWKVEILADSTMTAVVAAVAAGDVKYF